MKPHFSSKPIIRAPAGDIKHIYKSASNAGISEVYMSIIKPGATKGWKYHKQMTCRLTVIHGEVFFSIFSVNSASDLSSRSGFYLSAQTPTYGVLTIPPMHWFSFSSRSTHDSLILNCADLPHDDNEVVRAPLDSYPLD